MTQSEFDDYVIFKVALDRAYGYDWILPTDIFVLASVWLLDDGSGVSIKDITEQYGISRQTVQRSLYALSSHGLVDKERSKFNGRKLGPIYIYHIADLTGRRKNGEEKENQERSLVDILQDEEKQA